MTGKTTTPTTDPAEARARRRREIAVEIVAGWKAEEEDRMMERALALADQRLNAEERAARAADPQYWADMAAAAGSVTIAATWPGCPIGPDKYVSRLDPWSVDPAGVYFTDPDSGVRSFVSSPVVALDDGDSYAALVSEDWVTVKVPRAAGREAVLAALARSGVVFGDRVARAGNSAGDRGGDEPAETYASRWLGLGTATEVGDSSIITSLDPTRNRPDRGGVPETGEGKLQLAGALTRVSGGGR